MAGHRLGALEGGGGYLPPIQCIPGEGERGGGPEPKSICIKKRPKSIFALINSIAFGKSTSQRIYPIYPTHTLNTV